MPKCEWLVFKTEENRERDLRQAQPTLHFLTTHAVWSLCSYVSPLLRGLPCHDELESQTASPKKPSVFSCSLSAAAETWKTTNASVWVWDLARLLREKDRNSDLKNLNMVCKRKLSGQKDVLILQRIWVQVPASIWQLTTTCNFSLWRSGALFWPL